MIINVASNGGRSHLLDTARELASLGHTVRFYSFVPKCRAVKFGLPPECSRSIFLAAAPFLLCYRLFGIHRWMQDLYLRWGDLVMAVYMSRCDVFIGHAAMHLRSARKAREKWGATVICESGTAHLREWIEMLKADPSYQQDPVSEKGLRREEECYATADYVSVGCHSAQETFVKHGFRPERVFVNNYGFKSDFFPATALADGRAYDMVFVGSWSFRKGSDLLTELCRRRRDLTLLHVGSCSGAFPDLPNMTHHDAVPEWELTQYHQKARIFVLPSRIEGFGLVYLQAMASGLPIVCGHMTGGPDLRACAADPKWIVEAEPLTVETVEAAVETALSLARTQSGVRDYYRPGGREEQSWAGYGRRYDAFLRKVRPERQK